MAGIQRIAQTLGQAGKSAVLGRNIVKGLSTLQLGSETKKPTSLPVNSHTLRSNQAWLFNTHKVSGLRLTQTGNTTATTRHFSTLSKTTYVSPYELEKPPLKTIVLYNPSGHANNMAYRELSRAFPSIRIIQTQVPGRPIVKGISAENVLRIPEKSFGNMEVFKSELQKMPGMADAIQNGDVGFYAIWAPLAEDENVAREMQALGLTWIGASPESMEQLGKIEYKTLCKEQGLPTSPFFVLQPDSIENMTTQFQGDYANSELSGQAVFIKSASGGGGRGTRKLIDTTNRDAVFEAINAVAKEGRVDDIYVEMALNFSGLIESDTYLPVVIGYKVSVTINCSI